LATRDWSIRTSWRLRRDEGQRSAGEAEPEAAGRRKADTRKPRPTRPNEWWGIDMTKTMIDGFGWVYVVACSTGTP
jgi:hypothetical protein